MKKLFLLVLISACSNVTTYPASESGPPNSVNPNPEFWGDVCVVDEDCPQLSGVDLIGCKATAHDQQKCFYITE